MKLLNADDGFGDTPWDRLRNYELEAELQGTLGGDWVISEWCPFNGFFCAYSDVAPLDEMVAYREIIRGWNPKKVDVDYLVGQVDQKISERGLATN